MTSDELVQVLVVRGEAAYSVHDTRLAWIEERKVTRNL